MPLQLRGSRRVISAAVEAARDQSDSNFDRLDKRLDAVLDNNTREGDEAVVILMSFYLGEHEGEELNENLLTRGPRMTPLIQHYISQEPVALLSDYPNSVRLARATTLLFLQEDLEILRFRAGAHHIAGVSIETGPLTSQSPVCAVTLIHQPRFVFEDNLIQSRQSYEGALVLRAGIDEVGRVEVGKVLSSSGIPRLDARALKYADELEYAPRLHCGGIEANIVLKFHWTSGKTVSVPPRNY